jgi:preprotein translocase subunit SecY
MELNLNFLNSILKYIPNIKRPARPLSFKEKLQWTGLIMTVYFIMFSTHAYGVSTAVINQPVIQLVSIIFAAKIGSLITVGIGPIVLSSIVLQLLQGSGIVNIDLNDMEQRGKFQSIQKLSAMCIAIIESFVFTLTGYVPLASTSFFGIVVLQLAISAIIVIYLDEMMVKYGITSGINLFIAGGVAYALIAGTADILVPTALQQISQGGAAALPNAISAFGPLFFAVVVMFISIYVYDMKIELPMVFSQFRGIGGRLPIPFLYVSVLPVILATSLELSLTVWFSFIAGYHGGFSNLAYFVGYYQNVTSTNANGQAVNSPTLVGGLLFLVSPNFGTPYASQYGGDGSYGAYFSDILGNPIPLFLPWAHSVTGIANPCTLNNGCVNVPGWVHVIAYTLFLVILCVVFGKFYVEMTGQSPKNLASQLQEIGWQIPGFRRDPRVIESILNKYIPTITVLGSIFVALLAAFATLTGAVGTGMGVLLTVGIMYALYQQMERENMLEGYPALNKLLS